MRVRAISLLLAVHASVSGGVILDSFDRAYRVRMPIGGFDDVNKSASTQCVSSIISSAAFGPGGTIMGANGIRGQEVQAVGGCLEIRGTTQPISGLEGKDDGTIGDFEATILIGGTGFGPVNGIATFSGTGNAYSVVGSDQIVSLDFLRGSPFIYDPNGTVTFALRLQGGGFVSAPAVPLAYGAITVPLTAFTTGGSIGTGSVIDGYRLTFDLIKTDAFYSQQFSLNNLIITTPEPASITLAAIGLGAVALLRRRSKA